MKPYVLIEGSNFSIESFEQKIAAALEVGYVFAGELVAVSTGPGGEIKFYQPVTLEDLDDLDDLLEEDEIDDYEDDAITVHEDE